MFVNYERFEEIARGLGNDGFNRLTLIEKIIYLKEHPTSRYQPFKINIKSKLESYRKHLLKHTFGKSFEQVENKSNQIQFTKIPISTDKFNEWKNPTEVIGIQKGKELSFDEAIKIDVNPNFNLPINEGYRSNCFMCIASFVMQMKGFDIKTKPYVNTKKMFELSKYPNRLWLKLNKNKEGVYADPSIYKINSIDFLYDLLDKNIDKNGIYYLNFNYKLEKVAHIVIVTKDNYNRLVLFDPQMLYSNQTERLKIDEIPIKEYFKSYVKCDNIAMLRLDNLAFNMNYAELLFKRDN